MRIAIIGGGASGIITAWLLHEHHHVEIFESAPILGGHVRTLGKNVSCSLLAPDTVIENGVLGFHKGMYPNFLKLMDTLGVDLIHDRPFARLYSGTSQYPVGIKTLLKNLRISNISRTLSDISRIRSMVQAYAEFDRTLDATIAENSADVKTGGLLSPNRTLRHLQKAILMLSFSTPYEDVNDLPLGLTLPYLAGLRQREWCYVRGGVYTYLEKILEQINGQWHTNALVSKVSRSATGIDMKFAGGEQVHFDKVILAIPPGEVLKILDDPDERETRAFALWRSRKFETIAHTDSSVYRGFANVSRTPMDLFVDKEKRIAGYNTAMNRCYGLDRDVQYAFAYHLDERIDPALILDRQEHQVPVFHHETWKTREWIKELQGHRQCYYAGAWLGNGLHEGAVTSAIDVSLKLGASWA